MIIHKVNDHICLALLPVEVIVDLALRVGFEVSFEASTMNKEEIAIPSTIEIFRDKGFQATTKICPRRDSNAHSRFRKPVLYPTELRGLKFIEFLLTVTNPPHEKRLLIE
jgi:hypothetical protein